ncbi:MAG: hypothetical protein IIW40_00040 [Clostridia bacterium]|nr:hypothetical protein [Clostridia bacterium]
MAKTIHKLWYGEIDPLYLAGHGRADIKRLEELMRRNLEKVDGYLQTEEREWMEKYCHCAGEHETLLAEQAFSDGFCLGVRLMAEAMADEG